MLFTNALSKQVNFQTHKNSNFEKIQMRVPLFMVSEEKLKTTSWRMHNIKNCRKWIKNEKVMALQSAYGQKVEKVSHPTLGLF